MLTPGPLHVLSVYPEHSYYYSAHNQVLITQRSPACSDPLLNGAPPD